MKKLFNILFSALALTALVSCEKEPAGGTATQSMAGEWYCTVDAVDAEGNIIYEDPYGVGVFTIWTYNTNSNSPNLMYVDDQGTFWDFRVIVDINQGNRTFWSKGTEDDYWGINVEVLNGKISYGDVVSPAGYVTDGISFLVRFEDDEDADSGEWDYLWIHGWRMTGLAGGTD